MLTGALYLENLRKLGSKGHEKCILYEETMLTAQEFETMGGKKANKARKKSIKHKNKPISKFLSSGGLKEHAGDSLSSGSSQLQPSSSLSLPANKQSEMELILDELESKLTETIKGAVKSAISSLKSSPESEIQMLVEKVNNLTTRIEKLERDKPLSHYSSGAKSPPIGTYAGDLESIHLQIKQLTDSVNNNHKLLELKE